MSLAILGNEADAADATQDAFLAAWRQLRGLRDAQRLDAWLGRIAVNAARMLARGRRRRSVREIPSLAVDDTRPSPHGDPSGRAADDARVLGAALERLSPDQRAILGLRHLEGRAIAEIAARLGIREGTAKSRLFTARQALARALSEEERR